MMVTPAPRELNKAEGSLRQEVGPGQGGSSACSTRAQPRSSEVPVLPTAYPVLPEPPESPAQAAGETAPVLPRGSSLLQGRRSDSWRAEKEQQQQRQQHGSPVQVGVASLLELGRAGSATAEALCLPRETPQRLGGSGEGRAGQPRGGRGHFCKALLLDNQGAEKQAWGWRGSLTDAFTDA